MTRAIDLENDPFGFDFLKDLEDPTFGRGTPEPLQEPAPSGEQGRPTNRPTFDCEVCYGTGLWRAGVNRDGKRHCFHCNGKGYFLTSPVERYTRRTQKAAKARTKLEDALALFQETHPLIFEELKDVRQTGTRSDFVRSLSEQLFAKGYLTENQIAAWYRGKARLEEKKAQDAAEQKEASRTVDLSPILDMFTTARLKLKKPVYRAEGLVLSSPAAHSANAGGIYVKSEGQEYYGKVMGSTFLPIRNLRGAELERVTETLRRISANPKEVAVDYGRKTGTCACCGRKLTDPTSVALGIGPICIENWGF